MESTSRPFYSQIIRVENNEGIILKPMNKLTIDSSLEELNKRFDELCKITDREYWDSYTVAMDREKSRIADLIFRKVSGLDNPYPIIF